MDVNTGPLKFTIERRGGGGFLDRVYLSADGKNFTDKDLIAQAEKIVEPFSTY
ncbi:MAG: hypothetical protein NVV59_20640 [Chitinophagaceae bacterium]|nr:hypothetical protein [Chitinophagaceae bacterium]